MRSIAPFVACVCVSGLLAACGGSQSEAKEPDESAESSKAEKSEKAEPKEDKAEKEGSDDDDKGDKEDKADGDKKDKKDKKADKGGTDEKSGMPKVVRTAKDILVGKDVIFVFSFTQSEPYQKAEKKCVEKSKDDPKKKAECMTKAGNQFELDGITFDPDGDKWTWLTVRRKGNQLVTIHKIPVEFADEKDTSVKIKTLGPDKGAKPMAHVPKELVIDVPSETQISITDPKDGKMVYEAKMGMKGDLKR